MSHPSFFLRQATQPHLKKSRGCVLWRIRATKHILCSFSSLSPETTFERFRARRCTPCPKSLFSSSEVGGIHQQKTSATDSCKGEPAMQAKALKIEQLAAGRAVTNDNDIQDLQPYLLTRLTISRTPGLLQCADNLDLCTISKC